MRIRGVAAWGLILAMSALRVGPARADEEDDRRRKKEQREKLTKEITDLLRYVQDKLDRVPGSSGYYEIDDAKSYASQIKDKANELRSYVDGDSTADRIANYFPGYVDKFKESCDYLKQMKESQVRQADARLWESCQEWDRKLREDVDRFVYENDPDGLTEIPKLAESAKYRVEDKLKKADETHNYMGNSWKSYARNFSESSEWSSVTSELRDAVDATWDTWKQRHEATHMKCDDLAKGRNHPHVMQAMEKLASSGGSREAIIKRLDEHLDAIAGLLNGVKDRRDASEIDQAIRKTEELSSTLETLKNAQGKDKKAIEITGKWPDKAKEL